VINLPAARASTLGVIALPLSMAVAVVALMVTSARTVTTAHIIPVLALLGAMSSCC